MSTIIHTGDCRVILPTIPDNSIDSIVTDPPYELGFMGKSWDSTGIAYDVTVWQQCLRVLKPGGHIIAFGGSRTYHRLAVAIEDAGFEIRDQIQWIYGSGFPKSLDVSKALDKQAGAERTVVTEKREDMLGEYEVNIRHENPADSIFGSEQMTKNVPITAPTTDLAKQWQGWGTALKPAHEPAILARKSLTGTVADNVTAWGVGAINVDATRIATSKEVPHSGSKIQNGYSLTRKNPEGIGSGFDPNIGRWPANVIFDEEAAQILDEQSGHSVSSAGNRGLQHSGRHGGIADGGNLKDGTASIRGHSDSGGASRFFYVAKASKAEREAGLYNHKKTKFRNMNGQQRKDGSFQEWLPDPKPRANTHPTVKPITLMRYLIRMITPYGGIVLDPFTGSGSTGCAAVIENCSFVGMDITPEYVDIAKKRIDYYSQQLKLDIEV